MKTFYKTYIQLRYISIRGNLTANSQEIDWLQALIKYEIFNFENILVLVRVDSITSVVEAYDHCRHTEYTLRTAATRSIRNVLNFLYEREERPDKTFVPNLPLISNNNIDFFYRTIDSTVRRSLTNTKQICDNVIDALDGTIQKIKDRHIRRLENAKRYLGDRIGIIAPIIYLYYGYEKTRWSITDEVKSINRWFSQRWTSNFCISVFSREGTYTLEDTIYVIKFFVRRLVSRLQPLEGLYGFDRSFLIDMVIDIRYKNEHESPPDLIEAAPSEYAPSSSEPSRSSYAPTQAPSTRTSRFSSDRATPDVIEIEDSHTHITEQPVHVYSRTSASIIRIGSSEGESSVSGDDNP